MIPDLGKDGEVFAALAASALLKHCVGRWMRHRRSDRFEKVGTVSKLMCHPVKSCGELEFKEGECTPRGLMHNGIVDRHRVITDKNGVYITQRQVPRMALISVSDGGDTLQLDAPGMSPIQVPKTPAYSGTQIRKYNVKDEMVAGVDCGDPVAVWLSNFLDIPGLRLVVFPEDREGKDCTRKKKLWDTNILPGDNVAYCDWCPFMLMTQSSLEALNSELQKPVTALSFRGNVLIEGTPPFDEDTWEEVRIGEHVRMRVLDPCTRCVMTTVDPYTGVKSADGEPFKTLKKMRSFAPYSPKPCFGVDAAADEYGTVRVGDPVYVIRKQTK